jgi:hypothetical protein
MTSCPQVQGWIAAEGFRYEPGAQPAVRGECGRPVQALICITPGRERLAAVAARRVSRDALRRRRRSDERAPVLGAKPIMAALFLESFVSSATARLHVDFFGWNALRRPGVP